MVQVSPDGQPVSLTIRQATPEDADLILHFIRALADYEKLTHEVEITAPEIPLGDQTFGGVRIELESALIDVLRTSLTAQRGTADRRPGAPRQ